jgi:hypothetical protein
MTIAADALRDFVRRIESPPDRLTSVLARLDKCFGINSVATSRAYWLASRAFGLPYERGPTLIRLASAGDDRILDFMSPGIPEKECGFIYHAVTERRPGEVKIGFSRKPDERMRDLSGPAGGVMRIISLRPGIMLDEHVEHCARHVSRVFGEWFHSNQHLEAGTHQPAPPQPKPGGADAPGNPIHRLSVFDPGEPPTGCERRLGKRVAA